MFKNYLKVAFRNMSIYRTNSIINITGLAIGMAASLMIAIYVMNEKSYDKFNIKADRTYRIIVNTKFGKNNVNAASSPAPMADTLYKEIQEIENATRILNFPNRAIRCNDKMNFEDRFFYTDPGFFNVFTVYFIVGNPKTALSKPNSIVITDACARKYFGADDPVGNTIKIINKDSATYFITGVVKEFPANSHFHFDFLCSMSSLRESKSPAWMNLMFYTYVVLKPGANVKKAEAMMNFVAIRNMKPQILRILGTSFENFKMAGNKWDYSFQPLTTIHLHSNLDNEIEPNGNIQYIYVFSLVALFTLILACINFTNLATARSTGRTKEISLRKTVGSGRRQIIFQFILESVLYSLIALFVAVVLIELLLPLYNNILSIKISMNYISKWYNIPLLISLAFIVGLAAGIYPSLFLSSFSPVSVLKGKVWGDLRPGLLRNSLVVFQFSVSIVIIFGTYLVFSQLKFIQNKKMGFDKENVIVIHRTGPVKNHLGMFIKELEKCPSVLSASLSSGVPGKVNNLGGFLVEGASNSEPKIISVIGADYNFANALGIQMARGRYFSKESSSDSLALIINEVAVKALGLKEPLGTRLIAPSNSPREKPTYIPIIGVMKDFHFENLHKPINPLVIFLNKNYDDGYISVRVRPGDIGEAISDVNNTWNKFDNSSSVQYFFLNEEIQGFYKSEQRTSKILVIFSTISIVIACLGLFGLVSFIAIQRTKEIGVRKVNGATVADIMYLLSSEFAKLVLISFLIATPIGYYIINQWLRNFAYRTEIHWWTFVLVGILALGIAIATVIWQSWRTATKNPILALKYE